MIKKTMIKEIFTSIQGEGPYVGYMHLFIRFTKCNLKCKFCDTDFKTGVKEYTPFNLAEIANSEHNANFLSLTGGEPLMDADFLKEFLPLINKKIYLETNGTLYEELEKVIKYIDVVSMDIKLNSSSGNPDTYQLHEKFLKVAVESGKEVYIKIVFDNNITEKEIMQSAELAKKYNVVLVLQPKMDGLNLNVAPFIIKNVYERFISIYKNVRLIPQVHKFLQVE